MQQARTLALTLCLREQWANFPNNPLTVVVFSRDKGNFKDGLEVYDNRNICVTGTIKEYKGKPEIIITGPQDISIE